MRPPTSSNRIRSPRAISETARYLTPTRSPENPGVDQSGPRLPYPRRSPVGGTGLPDHGGRIMFGDYSLGDLGAILAMQGFAGLILFSVYVLMALGLAI